MKKYSIEKFYWIYNKEKKNKYNNQQKQKNKTKIKNFKKKLCK